VDGDADTESVQTESETAPAAEPATSEPDAAADEGQF